MRAQRAFSAEFPERNLPGYLRSGAVDTFTPCPISRIFESPSSRRLPDRGPMGRNCMATGYRGFQLGLLPEPKVNKRAVATAYGIVALVLLIVISLGVFMPEKLTLTQYHVTEIIPMPSLRPE